MSKKLMILIAFAIVLIWGCESKAPACTSLSWGEAAQVDKNVVEMKYSAGTVCENISDYYDVTSNDIKRVAGSLKSLKLLLKATSKCTQDNSESGIEEEVECPTYIPDIIEFGDIEGCKFDTPPDENTDCEPGGLTFYTASSTEYFEKVGWSFFPPEKINDSDIPERFFSFREDDTSMVGTFGENSSVIVRFSEVVYNDEGKQKKEFVLEYSVETKE
jgi:hypothetical protein